MEQGEEKNSDNSYIAKKCSPLQKVGEFIREARQGRNLSIEDLSLSLRIGQEQLIALEEGDEKSLPEKVYIKAMVRRISEKLNLDTSFIFEELNEQKKNEPQYSPVINKKGPRVFLQKFLHSGGLHSVVHNGGGCRPHSILHFGFSHIGVQF